MACRAQIRYVHLVGGGEVPLDVTIDPAGGLIPVVHLGVKCVRAREPGDGARAGFTVHWETCVDPAWWYARRQQADRSGATAPAVPRRVGRGVEQGPCAGCRRPDHIAYGPNCRGALCPDCRERLRQWRAAPEPRPPLQYPPHQASTDGTASDSG